MFEEGGGRWVHLGWGGGMERKGIQLYLNNNKKKKEKKRKPWCIYTMEYYATERKKELLPITTTWMELESIMLSEISQSRKDKYHMISSVSGT